MAYFPCASRHGLAILLLACAVGAQADEPQFPMDYRQSSSVDKTDISYFNGDIQLAATLLRPVNRTAKGTVILVHGSGRSSRKNVWAGMIAQLFVSNDIAVVFPDKRGSGSSGGNLRTSTLPDLADDAFAAVVFLQSHPELGAPVDKIGLVGLSQGGRVAPIVASQHPSTISFVVNISGGTAPGYVSIRYERENTYREKNINLEWLLRFRACDAAVDQLLFRQIEFSEYLPCTTLFANGPYAEFANSIYPSDPDDWRFGFYPQMLEFDPIVYWKKSPQPLFIAFGGLDELENVPVVLSVKLLQDSFEEIGKTNQTVRVYPDVGHALWQRSVKGFVFDREFVAELSDWLTLQTEK